MSQSGSGLDLGGAILGVLAGCVMTFALESPVFLGVRIHRAMKKKELGSALMAQPACAACGYSQVGLNRDVCPECGASPVVVRPPRPVGERLVMGMLTATVIGCCAGALISGIIVGADYAVFVVQASRYYESGKSGSFMRKRVWPFSDSSFVQDTPGGPVSDTG